MVSRELRVLCWAHDLDQSLAASFSEDGEHCTFAAANAVASFTKVEWHVS